MENRIPRGTPVAALLAVLLPLSGTGVHAAKQVGYLPAAKDRPWSDREIELATWSRFRPSALSMTFDDNSTGQFEKALPWMDAVGIRGTFFVIPDRMNADAWNRARVAAANGHEIGSHTLSHLVLAKETAARQEEQLAGSKRVIDSLIPSQKCLTLAYPYGVHDSVTLALTRRYYIAARVVGSYLNSAAPGDMYVVEGRGPEPKMDVHAYNSRLRDADSKGAWLVEMYHGIEDEGSEPIRLDWFRQHLGEIKAQESIVWAAPFVDVAEYIAERQCAQARYLSRSDSKVIINLQDTLPDSIYRQPLGLKIPLPPGWTGAEAEQAGAPMWCVIRMTPQGPCILFEGIPDRGPIVLTRRSGAEMGNTLSGKWDDASGPSSYRIRMTEGSWLSTRILNVKGARVGSGSAPLWPGGSMIDGSNSPYKSVRGVTLSPVRVRYLDINPAVTVR
ncbi:MAG: polysaccharide deacetylase [Fibrobacteres bacterium]|nr:polysaccharide deacetylase [Fibrobacterota bacterium]